MVTTILNSHSPKISYRYSHFTGYVIDRASSPNYHPTVCGILQMDKRIRKVTITLNIFLGLLTRISKKNQIITRTKGFPLIGTDRLAHSH